jgi:TRAP-type C4-dicarboxylate transport system permease small subunit
MRARPSLSERLASVLEQVGALALFGMMAVTGLDIAGRVLLNRPLAGSTDIVQVLLLVTAAFTLPSVTRRDEHLSIGLFDGAQPTPFERARRAAVSVLMALSFAALAVLLFGYAGETAANADVIGYLRLPLTPFVDAVSAMCAVCSLIAFIKAWQALPAPAAAAATASDPAGTTAPAPSIGASS